VVKLTFFVLDVADLPAVRAARDAVIDTARPPTSTAVQVAALFAPVICASSSRMPAWTPPAPDSR